MAQPDTRPVVDGPAWVSVAQARPRVARQPVPRGRHVIITFLLAALLVFGVVGGVASYVSSLLAERDAKVAGVQMTDLFAESVIAPLLTTAVVEASGARPEPGALADQARLDDVVRTRVLTRGILRVKVFTEQGRIVYSDEHRLIGQQFELSPAEHRTFEKPTTRADIIDTDGVENRFEAPYGRLVEFRRAVQGPSGQRFLVEVYVDDDAVGARARSVWNAFMALLAGSLVLFVLLLAPLVWQLRRRLRRAHQERELALTAAVDASTQERRRIAASLHDGPVQDLAASVWTVAGAAEQVAARGHPDLASQVREAGHTIRRSIASLRTLLVDLYPPHLRDAGIAAALADLVEPLRSRGLDVQLELDPVTRLSLTLEQERLVHRVAQEWVRNAVQHAEASTVSLSLRAGRGAVVLEVADDGVGFDVLPAMAGSRPGHLGLSVLADLAADAGAGMAVASAPGRGARWRLTVPREPGEES